MKNVILTLALILGSATAAMADDIHIRLSPNPASTQVNITFENPVHGDFTVEIYSVLGTKVLQQTFRHPEGTTTATVQTGSLADGIYLVRVTNGSESTVKRIKIQQG